MAVFRIERTRDYTVMSNHHLRNGKLSLKAKGLLSMMLSLPEDWNYTTRGLAAICKEGVDAIGGALRELETAGYIVRHQLRDRQGRISDTEYVIYEQPQPKNPDTPQPDTAERADERSTNSMNITYTQNGDYLIPNIIIRKTKPLGHYGRLRKAYLEMHRPILFNELVLSDKLFEHCAEIDETARNRMELIVRSLAEQNGVTEQLKAENQMEWVRQMNACKAQAEEIVKVELIYD